MCQKILSEGNTITLEKVINGSVVDKIPANLPGFYIVSEWYADIDRTSIDNLDEIAFYIRFRLKTPSRTIKFLDGNIKKSEIYSRNRLTVSVPGILVTESGIHFILVDQRDLNGRWKSVAKLPFMIYLKGKDAIKTETVSA